MRRKLVLSLTSILAALCASGTDAGVDAPAGTRTEVIYGRKHGMALTMDVLTPARKGNGAGVVWVESSGWNSSHDGVSPAIAAIFLKRGYTVFAVVHGSQPRFTVPEIHRDVQRAVRTVRHKARRFGIDADRLGVGGTSAGGHLALLLGVAADTGDADAKDPVDRQSARVQAVACLYPPTDFLNYGEPGKVALGTGPLAVVAGAFDFHEYDETLHRFVPVRDLARILEIGREISPVYHVTGDDPPTRIIHGDADTMVPFQQSVTMIKKLENAGVAADLVVKPGADHGWPNWLNDVAVLADWFDLHLMKTSSEGR